MKKFLTFFSLLLLLTGHYLQAQNKDYPWLIGFGTHGPQMSINDGPFFREYFRIRNWNLLPGIGKFWIDKSIGNSFSIGTQISIGVADRKPQIENKNTFFLDWDMNLKYKFANNYILKNKCWFDPYVIGSIGLTRFEAQTSASLGLGAGTNIWVTPKFGFNIETSYNKTLGKNRTPSYMHHAIGIVVRFGKGRDSDKDGIIDMDDQCKDVYGIEAFAGCPDTDGDGIPDKDDECISEAGLIDLMGCPDEDGDGIKDSEDDCPKNAGPLAFKGCPDSDGDGIIDKNDLCPSIKGTIAQKGCPDKDSDADGILDQDDRCPNEYGSVDQQGCPNVVVSDDKINKASILSKTIYFETAKNTLLATSYKDLEEVLMYLKEHNNATIMIEGHTDNVGDPSKNVTLSLRRSQAAASWLVAKGISASRIKSYGYGDTRPTTSNSTEAGRKENRRTTITILQ